ncbi:MAG TPA: hypothetical protein VK864_11330 [Longimicrobiales bacterium]|nr:hypothetical protein [Longimicrobiales bacterium]
MKLSRASLVVVLLTASCGGSNAPPSVEQTRTRPPNLTGVPVLFLPVQRAPVPSTTPTTTAPRFNGVDKLDAELAFWLAELAPGVKWILPPAIDRMLARTPSLGITPRALEVTVFSRAQVKRIGDPLYGDLRRLAAILDARLALVPVAAEFKPVDATQGRIEIALALIDVSFGDVVWFGVLAGDPGAPDSPTLAASAAQRIAAQFGQER